VRAQGDSEAVAATVFNRRSLVPCQVVLLSASLGIEAQIFEPPWFFDFRYPHYELRPSSTACSRAAKKSVTYQSLRSHGGSRDAIATHSTGPRSVTLPINLHFMTGLKRPLCAVAIVLGLVLYARAAELVEEQWSALFPHHTAIPEKFGAPIRDRFSDSDTMRAPATQMPVPAPGPKVTPSLADPKE
jgi:hypothetical protein